MRIELEYGIDIIGDIHACFDEFITLLKQLGYSQNNQGLYVHPEGRKILSLGDISSRGPYSLKTMEFFLRHIDAKLAYMIDSNHGWKIARWLDGCNVKLTHGDEKVEEELVQYEKKHGEQQTRDLKGRLKKMLMAAPSHYIISDEGQDCVVCAHAGIKDEYIGKENSRIKDFCRYGDVAGFDERGKPIRKDWFNHHKGELIIVWGHDPKREPLIVNNTINIDQGVVFGGKLTCYRYPEKEFVYVRASKNYSGRVGQDNPIEKE
ncbi:biotin transporter BioY [Lysinibacillus yapensis]|uniref:Biotin transporter BioY n=2 Tax=Ureibacillus yapensis TaxID=2304605 RepID=A0A396SFC7_9BACL|nr:biotin transporter BioY [Lysinibacillus yapensis]